MLKALVRHSCIYSSMLTDRNRRQVLLLWYYAVMSKRCTSIHMPRVLDCVHSALVTAAVYFYVVTNFGNVVVISKPHW